MLHRWPLKGGSVGSCHFRERIPVAYLWVPVNLLQRGCQCSVKLSPFWFNKTVRRAERQSPFVATDGSLSACVSPLPLLLARRSALSSNSLCMGYSQRNRNEVLTS